MNHCDEQRRGLLTVGVAGAAILLVPGCGGARNGPDSSDGGGPDDAGGDDDAPGDGAADAGDGGVCPGTCASGAGTLELTFAKFPQLKSVGGSANASAPGYKDPSCGLDLIVVAQPTAGKYVAFSAGCPHQCCTVAYNKSRTQFMCPCHGSIFNTSGEVVVGPAPKGLQQLAVCADDCGVTVSLP